MPQYKLIYLNAKGVAEGIRCIFAYMGKEFEDHRIETADWPSAKPGMPFGKVPVLEIDGERFHQSTAIYRYLAIEAGLAGSTPLENLRIDQAGGAIIDLIPETLKMFVLDGKEREAHKVKLTNEIIPYYFGKFDQLIKENNGYLANGKLSWADFLLVGYSETISVLTEVKDLNERFPNFGALFETIHSLPGVKEWIEKRPSSI